LERGHAASARPTALDAPAALVLGAREGEAPAAVVDALELGIDETVNRLVADDPMSLLAGQLTRPAPSIGMGLCIGGLATEPGTTVTLQLARDGRRLAIQGHSDLPDRLPVFMMTGNRAALLNR
jgi:hypothetical protein